MRQSGRVPLLIGSLAVLAGAAFLWDVGALPGMVSRNIAAYLVGLAFGWAFLRIEQLPNGALALLAGSTAILAAVLVTGTEVDGVRRWLAIGSVQLQPALILAPLLLGLATRREARHWRAALLLPLALIVAQPDAATSLALACGLATLIAGESMRGRNGWPGRRLAVAFGAVALSVFGLVIMGIRTPPPVAFVEGTVGIAALSGAQAIVLHSVALTLAIASTLASGVGGLAIAAYFATAMIVATFSAFPMPVAGAGPSHLIGFGLAVSWLACETRNKCTTAVPRMPD